MIKAVTSWEPDELEQSSSRILARSKKGGVQACFCILLAAGMPGSLRGCWGFACYNGAMSMASKNEARAAAC